MTMPRRLYVAGPMTGLPEFNFPAFAAAATALRGAGYDVVAPNEVPLPCGCMGDLDRRCAGEHTWAQYVRADLIAFLAHADGVALLPGWENSRGAKLERHIAVELEMDVRPLAEWLAVAERAA